MFRVRVDQSGSLANGRKNGLQPDCFNAQFLIKGKGGASFTCAHKVSTRTVAGIEGNKERGLKISSPEHGSEKTYEQRRPLPTATRQPAAP